MPQVAFPSSQKTIRMQKHHTTVFYRIALGVVFCSTSFLALTGKNIPVAKDINDKINHIAAFYTLALLTDFSWPTSGFRAPKVLALLGYGLAIEIVQYFLPHRSFSLFDLGADAVGMLLYLISVPLLKRIYPLSLRFAPGE